MTDDGIAAAIYVGENAKGDVISFFGFYFTEKFAALKAYKMSGGIAVGHIVFCEGADVGVDLTELAVLLRFGTLVVQYLIVEPSGGPAGPVDAPYAKGEGGKGLMTKLREIYPFIGVMGIYLQDYPHIPL